MHTRFAIHAFCFFSLLSQSNSAFAQEYATPGFNDLWRPCQGRGCSGHKKFLYWATKGQALMLAGQYDESNFCLEMAVTTWMDRSARYLKPHEDSYDEVHEFMMAIYYKALNYLTLGKLEDAMVECKRLNDWLLMSDMHPVTRRLIEGDSLISSVMGLVYDLGGHVDDAIISFDEAQRQFALNYRGLMSKHIPSQLMRETEFLFSLPEMRGGYAPASTVYGAGRVLVIWNNGASPETLVTKRDFVMSNMEFANDVSAQLVVDELQDTLLSFYKFKEPVYKEWQITRNGEAVKGEILEDVNWYAVRALEFRIKSPGVHVWRRGSNWSTLPHSIYFAIIPLRFGDNQLRFTLFGDHGVVKKDSVSIPGDGYSHFYMINTLDNRPIKVVSRVLKPELAEVRPVAPSMLNLPETLRVRR